MKKNFKLMLVALFALMGVNSAFAQAKPVVGAAISDDDYSYVFTAVNETKKTAELKITALNGDKSGAITLPEAKTKKYSGEDWTLKITAIQGGANPAFKDQVALTKVTFNKEMQSIQSGAFKGCTLLEEVVFPANSELRQLWDNCFATTQIANPDFSNCVQLEYVGDYIFTEGSGTLNSYVKTIKLPASALLKNFRKGFANLPELTTLDLTNSKIETLVANAFANDAKLTKMELPGTVKEIAAKTFESSKVEDLTIDLTSIETIGDGVDAVYGSDAGNVLLKLTFKNALKGKIKKNAFAGELKIGTEGAADKKYPGSDVLDMHTVALGTTGQIEEDAFKGINAVKKVWLGDISNNTTGGWTIAKNAFTGTALAEVEIGNISTSSAINETAFGDKLVKVTIGNIYATAAIAKDAFKFKANDGGSTVIIGNVRSLDANTPVMDESAFNLSANNGKAISVTIGAVEAKGKNFTGKDFTGQVTSLTFTGDIEQSGLVTKGPAASIVSELTKITAITFKGKVAANGIPADAFAGAKPDADHVLTVKFEKELAPAAIAAGAFTLNVAPAGDGKKVMVVDYQYASHPNTFLSGMPWAQTSFYGTLQTEKNRDIEIKIATPALKTTFEDNQADDASDVTFRAMFKVTPPSNFFVVYGDNNNQGVSYARILLEHGKMYEIDRRPTGKDADGIDQTGITYTLYTVYKEEDDDSKISTLNMLPMISKDGTYYVDLSGETKDLVVIVKATGTEKVADKETKMWYNEVTSISEKSNIYNGDGSVRVASKVVTNEQLRDGNGNPYPYICYYAETTESQPLTKPVLAANNLFLLTNPAGHKGLSADPIDFVKSGKPFINIGNFYALGKKYASAARMIINWIGDDEATGIIEAKTAAKVANNDAIYNLQGIRVNGTQKGIYIQNGKKFIVK